MEYVLSLCVGMFMKLYDEAIDTQLKTSCVYILQVLLLMCIIVLFIIQPHYNFVFFGFCSIYILFDIATALDSKLDIITHTYWAAICFISLIGAIYFFITNPYFLLDITISEALVIFFVAYVIFTIEATDEFVFAEEYSTRKLVWRILCVLVFVIILFCAHSFPNVAHPIWVLASYTCAGYFTTWVLIKHFYPETRKSLQNE